MGIAVTLWQSSLMIIIITYDLVCVINNFYPLIMNGEIIYYSLLISTVIVRQWRENRGPSNIGVRHANVFRRRTTKNSV